MPARKNDIGLFEEDIDGLKYEFEKWGADDATDALLDIVSIAGKPIGMGVAALFGGDEPSLDKKINPDTVAVVMDALMSNVTSNKATIKGLIKKLASSKVTCDGKQVNFDLHYKSRLDHLFRVVKSALEVQYGNFFDAFLGASGIKRQVTDALTRGGPISNGPSGGQSAQV